MAGRDDTGKLDQASLQEQRVLARLHALRADRAPDRLRAEIERLRPAPRQRARIWRLPATGLATASALAAVAVAVVVLSAGGAGAPSVLQAAALALKGPLVGAPAPAREAPRERLDQSVEQIYFPNWARFGWRATGQRVDRIGGRRAVTVYYAGSGRSIAYTIVAVPPVRQPSAVSTTIDGNQFRTLHMDRRLVVTWRRQGHTCILSGTGISAQVLFKLADWHPAGSDY